MRPDVDRGFVHNSHRQTPINAKPLSDKAGARKNDLIITREARSVKAGRARKARQDQPLDK
jgi:hypothetical protein